MDYLIKDGIDNTIKKHFIVVEKSLCQWSHRMQRAKTTPGDVSAMSKQRLQMLPALWGNTLKLNHIIWPREQAFVSDWLLRRSPVCRAQTELRWVVGREETAVTCGEQWIRMRYEKQGREAGLMAERGKCKKKKEKRAWWRVTLIEKKCKLAIKVLSYSQL